MSCEFCDNEVVDIMGLCNTDKFSFDPTKPEELSWTEISVAEVLVVPSQKPDIESLEKVLVDVNIISKRVIKTPESPKDENGNYIKNKEKNILTGRKLIIEGILSQKVVYTADLPQQSVHSVHFDIPFSAFIVIPKEIDIDGEFVDSLDIKFCVQSCIEDVFVKAFSCREIFNNVTLFLRALPLKDSCM